MNCPTCGSHDPRFHPATQAEGEVIARCPDTFHQPSPADRTTHSLGLTDYDLHVPLTANGHQIERTFNLRIPATSSEAALDAASELVGTIITATDGAFGLPPAAWSAITAHPARTTIHPAEDDRWHADLCPGVRLTIDTAGCFVLRYPGGSATITNLEQAERAVALARATRDAIEGQESRR